jgi:hypothetical protein
MSVYNEVVREALVELSDADYQVVLDARKPDARRALDRVGWATGACNGDPGVT